MSVVRGTKITGEPLYVPAHRVIAVEPTPEDWHEIHDGSILVLDTLNSKGEHTTMFMREPAPIVAAALAEALNGMHRN